MKDIVLMAGEESEETEETEDVEEDDIESLLGEDEPEDE